jgi:hypothetical protein
MGTMLHLRTINQTTEPKSQTILYGKSKLRQLVRFPRAGGSCTCSLLGAISSKMVPCPSWPEEPRPHVYTRVVSVTTAVCCHPHATCRCNARSCSYTVHNA